MDRNRAIEGWHTTKKPDGIFLPDFLSQIGLEGKGFEPTLEALFGKQGFFPDSVNKALYWVDDQVPDHVSKVLVDHFGYTKDDKREQVCFY